MLVHFYADSLLCWLLIAVSISHPLSLAVHMLVECAWSIAVSAGRLQQSLVVTLGLDQSQLVSCSAFQSMMIASSH